MQMCDCYRFPLGVVGDLQQNRCTGVLAHGDAVVEVRGCFSSGHGLVGDLACTAQMTVSNSSSDGDMMGCEVSHGGQLTMEVVAVDGVPQSGKLP